MVIKLALYCAINPPPFVHYGGQASFGGVVQSIHVHRSPKAMSAGATIPASFVAQSVLCVLLFAVYGYGMISVQLSKMFWQEACAISLP